MKELTPKSLNPPLARYAHGVEIPASWRIVQTSGQLGIRLDGTIPADAYEQAKICFENIREILKEAGMCAGDVSHISAYVTDRLPSSTLLIVSGFTREEFKVEVEVLAAAQ